VQMLQARLLQLQLPPPCQYQWQDSADAECNALILTLQLRKSHGQAPQQAEHETEMAVVVQAVCATKLPTLTFRDVARLRGLIADIFPGRRNLRCLIVPPNCCLVSDTAIVISITRCC
jgi:hypothetical protein